MKGAMFFLFGFDYLKGVISYARCIAIIEFKCNYLYMGTSKENGLIFIETILDFRTFD